MDNKKQKKFGLPNISAVLVPMCILTIVCSIVLAEKSKKEQEKSGDSSSSVYVMTYDYPDTDVQTGNGTSEQTNAIGTDTQKPDVSTDTSHVNGTGGGTDSTSADTEPETSDIPESSSEAGITTSAPVATTQTPIETTALPEVITTQSPVITTQKPIVTTQKPIDTTRPIVTTKPPVVTTRPIVTSTPSVTTQTPVVTTEAIITTQIPVTPTGPAETTQSPEISQGQIIVKPDLKFGQQEEDVLIAPNGDLVEGYWIRDGGGTHFIVNEPVFEYGNEYRWWGYDSYKNELIAGVYYYFNKKIIAFKPDTFSIITEFVESKTGMIHTEQEYTAPPGTWW